MIHDSYQIACLDHNTLSAIYISFLCLLFTAYVGKYLNEYNGTYVPLGWNDWVGLLYNSKYYNYTLNVNGRLQYHGNDYYRDYLPDLIANESVRIMQQHKLYFKHQ